MQTAAKADSSTLASASSASAASYSASSASSAPTVPWSWLLTLYSGHSNRDGQGRPRINVNGPNLVEIHQKLTAVVGPELASFLVAYRQFGPSSSAAAATTGVVPVDLTLPPIYSLQSIVDMAGVGVAVANGKSGGSTVVYQSPLSADAASQQKLTQLLDTTTLDDAPLRRGLVSVNDAPSIVLQTVPGIDEALAQQIVAARQNAPSGEGTRRYPTWLLTEGLVDLETMKRLLPHLSGSGDVVRAQVVAHFDQPGLSARAEVVLDGTSDSARIAMWRDLRFYGFGYPTEWLTAGAPRGARN
jgi:DNA uptake protein ComE-like DNA-binding protein